MKPSASTETGPLRIRYQSFGPEDDRGYRQALARLVAAAGDDSRVSVEVRGLEGSVLARKQHRAFHLAGGADVLDAVHAAEADGVAAVAIGNIQDPALAECRQVCSIPVVGLLESSLATTRPFGANVGLVTTRSFTHALLRERVLVYGEERRLHSIRTSDLAIPQLELAFTDRDVAAAADAQFRAVAAGAVAEGCEIVVPASGILATLLASLHGNAAAWDLGVGSPVANPVWLAIAAAASAARVHRAGLEVSRSGSYGAPDPAVLAEYFAARRDGGAR